MNRNLQPGPVGLQEELVHRGLTVIEFTVIIVIVFLLIAPPLVNVDLAIFYAYL